MATQQHKTPKFQRSQCPIAATLDTLGDKWSLVVIRDMFSGKKRFSEFIESPEGIKRNILTERLKRLEASGIIQRLQYQARPDRFEYHLSSSGAELLPILQAIARWGSKHIEGVWKPSATFYDWKPEQFLPRDEPSRRSSAGQRSQQRKSAAN